MPLAFAGTLCARRRRSRRSGHRVPREAARKPWPFAPSPTTRWPVRGGRRAGAPGSRIADRGQARSRSVLGRSPDEATACSSWQASCCPSFRDRLLADVLGLPRALYFEEKFLTAAETTWVTRGVAMS